MSQNAVIYCRAASVVDGDNQQVQAQEELCRAYAQSKGYSVENVFVDKGVSGSTLERPQFKNMVEFLNQKKELCPVIIASYDRAGRDPEIAFKFYEHLSGTGGVLVVASDEENSYLQMRGTLSKI